MIFSQMNDVSWLEKVAQSFGLFGFELAAILSVILVCTSCGMVGSLVVGNRMAFFSDAMAHSAFAGLSLGVLLCLGIGLPPGSEEARNLIPLIMVLFGLCIGVGIAFVREKTGLSGDTVIGVFFAGSIGTGAVLLSALPRSQKTFNPERFLFGGPAAATGTDILYLFGLLIITSGLIYWRYNQFQLASMNPSLARSRLVPVRFNDYLFIVLLALVVNLSISAVGVLLINAMLVLPAATATNLATSQRQMFRMTVGVSVGIGIIGLFACQNFIPKFGDNEPSEFGVSGSIIVIGVLLFFFSMIIPYLRKRYAHLG
ncbi:MAG: metal ABC transporter permease [Gemmataceae bacterium]|nr:metal ABC transporter permease [Gemmataceae bacterium]